MITIKFVSILASCAIAADVDPWDGVNCGNEAMGDDVCQPGLEFVYEDPANLNSSRKCCHLKLGDKESTYNNCLCMPCGMNCSSTLSAQEAAKAEYLKLGFSENDAKSASETYLCADSILWTKAVPADAIFKCCVDVTADHKCKCPPKDDTKKCYSTWSNPDLYDCNFGKPTSGDVDYYCCLDSDGNCKSDSGSIEGYSDWANCWNSSESECHEKATETSPEDPPKTAGCVWDVMPTQKYCGITASSDLDCQDRRPFFNDNNCGLSAVSDTDWFVNRRLSTEGAKLQWNAMQAIRGPTMYCGSYWYQPPSPSVFA